MTRRVKSFKQNGVNLPLLTKNVCGDIMHWAKQYRMFKNDPDTINSICRNLSNLLNDNTTLKYYRIHDEIIEPRVSSIIPNGKKTESMLEHVVGRQYSAELILDYINDNNIKKITDDDAIQLFKRFSPTLAIRKNGNFHTRLNYKLQDIQRRGKVSFDAYNNILDQFGYNKVNEKYRVIFPNY